MKTYDIKTIEDLSLNAWPSHQMEIYDGWLLRFSYFYTHRTNCVEQIGGSSIPLDEKITYCESIYRHWCTPCIFKISPLTPLGFDRHLEELGYHIEHSTEVKTMDLSKYQPQTLPLKIRIEKEISWEWLEALFYFKRTVSMVHKKIVPTMYAAIPKDTIVVSIAEDNRIIAIGLGILDRDHLGLYAIHVDASCRRRHMGEAICRTILQEGIRQDAKYAYLQVEPGNIPAKSLYHTLGFEDFYSYHFRVKNV